jgi:hypothetical protein
MPSTGTSCEYVVLMPRQEIDAQFAKLDSMERFLTKASWSFKVCDLEDVLDSLGGVLPTDWNLDVFEEKVVKLQELPAGRYQGGVTLRMRLFELHQQPDLRRFVGSVAALAKPYRRTGTGGRTAASPIRQRRP